MIERGHVELVEIVGVLDRDEVLLQELVLRERIEPSFRGQIRHDDALQAIDGR